MPERWREALLDRPFLVELFIAVNLSFLALDIYVAHSVNMFRHPAEWIPFGFTLLAAVALLANLALSAPVRGAGGARRFDQRAGLWVGVAVGGLGVVVGVAGLLWHLRSDFFEAMTLRSLVYSAPFVAPLAFTGVGLLLLLNRLVPKEGLEWGQWVMLLAWGGFFGNFGLSLVDHAQNGFFYLSEWVPVVVAAVTVGTLIVPIFLRVPATYYRLVAGVLVLAAVTGVVGFVLHVTPVFTEVAGSLRDRVVHGAPVFAPLLFTNLALLGGLGAWDLWAKGWVGGVVPAEEAARPPG